MEKLRQLTVYIVEVDSEGMAIRKTSKVYKYRYGSRIIDLVSVLIKSYNTQYDTILSSRDVKVYQLTGYMLRKNSLILGNYVGFNDKNAVMVHVHVPVEFDAIVSTPEVDFDEIIQSREYKKLINTIAKLEGEKEKSAIELDVANKELQALRQTINNLEKGKTSLTTALESSKLCQQSLEQTNSKLEEETRVLRVGDDVIKVFASELNMKSDELQKLLPLLASIGVRSMGSLLGTSSSQIDALELKPVKRNKLLKLIESKRSATLAASGDTNGPHHSASIDAYDSKAAMFVADKKASCTDAPSSAHACGGKKLNKVIDCHSPSTEVKSLLGSHRLPSLSPDPKNKPPAVNSTVTKHLPSINKL